jgi:hypothetical protein
VLAGTSVLGFGPGGWKRASAATAPPPPPPPQRPAAGDTVLQLTPRAMWVRSILGTCAVCVDVVC